MPTPPKYRHQPHILNTPPPEGHTIMKINSAKHLHSPKIIANIADENNQPAPCLRRAPTSQTQIMKNSVIIVSGGMDSITLLYDHKDDIALGISFDYGSNHNAREIPFARMHCQRLGIPHITINLDFMHQYFKSSLLEGAEAIPEGHYADDNMKSTVVPFRNGIMLSIAIGIAESNNLDQVYIANHGGDHTIYPDCRPEFIGAIDAAATAGTYNNVRVVAPYTQITKADIARIGKRLGIDYTQTWSCYKGGRTHCGKCGTCVERKEALAEAGIEDKTEYGEK